MVDNASAAGVEDHRLGHARVFAREVSTHNALVARIAGSARPLRRQAGCDRESAR